MADNAIATTANNGTRLDPLKQIASNPATRQFMLLVAVAAAVALGVAVVLWSRGPSYGLLYAGLEQKDAAAITQELQASNTPYQLGNDGSSIMAPTADLAALRLRLAAKGLPQGSAASSALPAADSPFGMSDLAERTRYQQLLETDLGTTISGLQSVRAARVHLALPKPSAFVRDSREASASVLVTLYPGRQLDAGQVAAIVHLVAASVPELDPRQVSVIDQQGQLLTSDPDSPGAVGDNRLRMTTRIENTYAQRIEELLTPLVGPGRVRAQVYADLDFSQSEKATETFGHDHPALRSEQTSSEHRGGGTAAAGGVPGALSNQPPTLVAQPTAARPEAGKPGSAGATATAAGGTGENSSSATRNYELDRTISHVSDPAGRLARLTVAVVLDDKLVAPAADPVSGAATEAKSVPFSAQELQRLTELTKNAVGFNAARGDSVSVVNQAFHRDPAPDALPATPLWERPGAMDLFKQGLGVLIALLVAFGLLRPLLKGLLRGEATARALPAPMPKISVRVDDEPARLDAVPTLAYEQRIGQARRMVGENSKQVAQVVRNWVSEDGN
ncbi:flagellar M-ring protein FliF [Rhodanobacter sp. FW510-R12]|uniref:flagellar basal-body MS-ring/collar protein FliF n=1 Tax=unclassified Rhodanobacter TaxID=2621553 RepID=UPI0007AA2A69|nr:MULTISPECIES: flagellar basal-body MS-ring/collar protein FliF [unclassified Rhodanobacter]KZC16061.1 flagellar M-ring protein FliF [Rhodanobacter sp. FW104-R8]KZC26640.1 flagellar M-ring protein FliF [Rhodanobacter sp. FW510-T8]KZC30529.1 flagellar M-ring protein FliF [Rhodanobacter sp. FW510-R10]